MKCLMTAMMIGASLAVASVQAQAQQPTQSQPNAQSPQSTQKRPDARYPNPSGQDSKPSETTVKPTETKKPSANPEDPSTSTKGKAAEETYQTGKKADAAAGCSTPTDAKAAGVDASHSKGDTRRNGTKTVCTTAGGEAKEGKRDR